MERLSERRFRIAIVGEISVERNTACSTIIFPRRANMCGGYGKIAKYRRRVVTYRTCRVRTAHGNTRGGETRTHATSKVPLSGPLARRRQTRRRGSAGVCAGCARDIYFSYLAPAADPKRAQAPSCDLVRARKRRKRTEVNFRNGGERERERIHTGKGGDGMVTESGTRIASSTCGIRARKRLRGGDRCVKRAGVR